jgi:4,5-DOPA dioxygenase extradiol
MQESKPTVSSAPRPSMLYDYYGFPEESYKIKYEAPGSPELAQRLMQLLR